MCGIAGLIGIAAVEAQIDQMLDAIVHRGPDDRGVWFDPSGGATLGHTRLSIIDLSSGGHQPMTIEGGRYWITFNGEIYNYLELRSELEKTGATFNSHCDTEVLLSAFAHWGVDCLHRLRGMFAFALWDRHEQTLFLARDRMGIKPLLWAEVPGGFVFASEIKALLASGLVKPVIEPHAVFELLATGAVCQPETILRGVYSLDPGTCLILRANGTRENVRYWNPIDGVTELRSELLRLSYVDAVHLIRQKLEEACQYHMIADVPIGSFLSGGIDSTAVTALMTRHFSNKVRSFSIGFEATPELEDELSEARLAAEHIGCDHTEIVLSARDITESFDDLISSIDQPSQDGTNTYFVSRAARKSVKVTLSGLGGDELFAGYPHFSLLQGAASRPINVLDRCLSLLNRLRPNRFTSLAATRCLPVSRRYAELRRILSDKTLTTALARPLRSLFSRGLIENIISPLLDVSLDAVSQTSIVECRHYLVNTLLRDADAMSMAHGLEVRPVLLDHTLVECALALPPEMKIRNGRSKSVLIDAVHDLLPATLLQRRKTGFEMPLGTWLRKALRERLLDCLNDPWMMNLFEIDFIRVIRRNIDNVHYTRLLWALLILVSWARNYKCTLGTNG
jgi:asparagine synthase (glutamine-hydrolysing)